MSEQPRPQKCRKQKFRTAGNAGRAGKFMTGGLGVHVVFCDACKAFHREHGKRKPS